MHKKDATKSIEKANNQQLNIAITEKVQSSSYSSIRQIGIKWKGSHEYKFLHSLFESLLEATFEILKRILCTLKWNSAKSIVPSFSRFFYIVLQKWIYSCFSKLVQNKIFWKKIIKLYPHQLKTPWGFCTDGENFFHAHFSPGVRACLPSLHMTTWATCTTGELPDKAAEPQKASSSTCTWLGLPKFTQPRFTEQLKNSWGNLLREMSFFLYLMQKDPHSKNLMRKKQQTLIIQVQSTRTRISLKCEERFF